MAQARILVGGAVAGLGVAVAGVAPARGPAAPSRRPAHRAVCDSARAARVALDSLARLAPFRSAVLRFTRDSAGARIGTGPAPRSGGPALDGMAVVRVGPDCRIRSVFQTDSA